MARQDKRQKALRSGLDALRRDGLETESPDAALVEPLLQRFGSDPDVSLAVVHVLGRIRDAASVAVLEGLEERAGSKEVRREIRRSLFRLAQGGVVSAEPRESESPGTGPNFSLAPEIEGYLASVTGGGDRLVILARPEPGGGLLVLNAAVNDRLGLGRLEGAVVLRKDFRRMMEGVKAQHQASVTPVPWEYADWLMHEAYRKTKGPPGEGAADYPVLRSRLSPVKAAPRSHPVFDRVDTDAVGFPAPSEVSEKLLEDPELRTWFVEKDLVDPWLERVEDTEQSRIVLNPAQRQERFRGIVREAVEGIFLDPDLGPVFEQRLEDAALHMHAAGREEQARAVLALALAIRRGDLGSLGAPFLEALVVRSLGFHKAREKEAVEEEPSLIVKP